MSDTRHHPLAKSFICCSTFVWTQVLVGLVFLQASDFRQPSTLYIMCGAIIFGMAFVFFKALGALKIIRSDLVGFLTVFCFTLFPNLLIFGLTFSGVATPMEAFLIATIISLCAGLAYFKFSVFLLEKSEKT